MSERDGERPDTPADEPAPTITGKVRSDSLLRKRGGALRVKATATMHERYREVDQPAPALSFGHNAAGWEWVNTRQRSRTSKGSRAEDYRRRTDRPSPTLTAQSGGFWQWEEPATTVCGDPRISPRGHHGQGGQTLNAKTTEEVQAGDYTGIEAVKLTIQEALILQGFDPDYPVKGSRTKQFEQVGNAVPPPLAAHVLRALIFGE